MEERRSEYLADITKRGVFGGGVVKREACVFACKLVSVVDGMITGMAESCFICRTEHRGFLIVTHITLDLHLDLFLCFCVCSFEFWLLNIFGDWF